MRGWTPGWRWLPWLVAGLGLLALGLTLRQARRLETQRQDTHAIVIAQLTDRIADLGRQSEEANQAAIAGSLTRTTVWLQEFSRTASDLTDLVRLYNATSPDTSRARSQLDLQTYAFMTSDLAAAVERTQTISPTQHHTLTTLAADMRLLQERFPVALFQDGDRAAHQAAETQFCQQTRLQRRPGFSMCH